jgi:hypothetical protein
MLTLVGMKNPATVLSIIVALYFNQNQTLIVVYDLVWSGTGSARVVKGCEMLNI